MKDDLFKIPFCVWFPVDDFTIITWSHDIWQISLNIFEFFWENSFKNLS